MIESGGIGTAPEESVPRFDDLEVCQKGFQVVVGFYFTIPLALPLDDEIVPLGEQSVFLGAGGFVHLLEGPVRDQLGVLISVGITSRTPVPQTAVELVDGPGEFVVPVDGDSTSRREHSHFPAVTHMTYAVSRRLAGRGSRGVDTQTVFLPSQPLEGFDELIGSQTVPSARRFHGKGVVWQ